MLRISSPFAFSAAKFATGRQSFQLDTRQGACQTIQLHTYTTYAEKFGTIFKRKAPKKALQVLGQTVGKTVERIGYAKYGRKICGSIT